MEHRPGSIRPFIEAGHYEARRFYVDPGFEESVLSHTMSYFDTRGIAGA